jgi:prophage regulatory protein
MPSRRIVGAQKPGPYPCGACDPSMTSNSPDAETSPCLTLERLPQVRARCGLSRSEIYRRIAAGDFPRPIKLGERASAWAEHEVTAWIAARIAARDNMTTGAKP